MVRRSLGLSLTEIVTFFTILAIVSRLGASSLIPSFQSNYIPRIISTEENNNEVIRSIGEAEAYTIDDTQTADREGSLKTNKITRGSLSNTQTRHPVILIPGDGGSQIEAKLDKPETPHFFCEKKSDWFDIWLNLEQLIPYIMECWVDNMRLVYDNVTRTTSNSPGVQIRVPNFGKKEMGDFFAKSIKLIEDTYTDNNEQSCILICHSSGCLNTLYLLNQQPQTWKDKYVKSLVSLGGPWGGAIKAMKTFTSGDNVGVVIVNPLTVRKEQRTSPSLAFLMPSKHFWSESDPIIISKSKNYSLGNLEEFFNDISWPIGYQMWLDYKDIVQNFKPPGVEVHCLYGVGVETMERAIYTSDKFPDENPRLVNGEGDGTVNLVSLEGCSRWKSAQSQGVYTQSYNGVDHMQILHDTRVLEYIKNLTIPH